MISFQVLLVSATLAVVAAGPHDHGWGWGSSGWGQSGWGRPEATSARPPSGGNGGGSSNGPAVDNRSLDELYQAALIEGGIVTVYGGGDSPGQLDGMKVAFEKQFPNVTLNVIVDFSKNHDARIDLQLAAHDLVPDVAQLQTVQNFPRWKDEGVLMAYKPVGWDAVYPQFKDAQGFWTGILCVAFSNNINTKVFPNNSTWPVEANDYLRPEAKGKIISTYPNDDDAVLFWYKQVVDKYGWDWLRRFVQQNVTFVRGAQVPSEDVYAGKYGATFSTDGVLVTDPATDVVFVLPKETPFVSWAQRAAIFKDAKHPNAAKLYLSWMLDINTQSNIWYMWSVRRDVPVPPGYKSIFDYPNTDPTAFVRFMEDRTGAERFRAQITQIVGEVKGDSPTGNLGLRPTQPIPH